MASWNYRNAEQRQRAEHGPLAVPPISPSMAMEGGRYLTRRSRNGQPRMRAHRCSEQDRFGLTRRASPVIASVAKQSPGPHRWRLLRYARNDRGEPRVNLKRRSLTDCNGFARVKKASYITGHAAQQISICTNAMLACGVCNKNPAIPRGKAGALVVDGESMRSD